MAPIQTISASSTNVTVPEQKNELNDITKVTEAEYLQNVDGIEKVNALEFMNLINSKKSFYVYIGYKECPYCREFSKVLDQFKTKTDRPIYYFDMDEALNNLTEDQVSMIKDTFQNTVHFYGTPTFELFINGLAEKEYVGSTTTLSDLEHLKNIYLNQGN